MSFIVDYHTVETLHVAEWDVLDVLQRARWAFTVMRRLTNVLKSHFGFNRNSQYSHVFE